MLKLQLMVNQATNILWRNDFEELQVYQSFLKRVSETSFVLPEKEDHSSISTDEIVKTVCAIPDRRGLVWTINCDIHLD